MKKLKLPKKVSPKKTSETLVAPVKEKKVSKTAALKKQFYVNPKDFTEELQNYYRTNVITDNLALMIRNIAYGLAHAPNFINYTFKEEAIGDSLINMFSALMQKKYKFDKGFNPFSYFNSIAFNCWRSRIKKEKRMRDTLAAYQEEVYSVIGPQVGVDDPVNPLNKNAN